MSLNEFWISIRAAANFIAPNAIADSDEINEDYLNRSLQRAVIWLTPKSVEGFKSEDFIEILAADELDELNDHVERFRKIAKTLPPTEPATDQQIKKAIPAFRGILEIIRLDKYADADALVLGKKIDRYLEGKIPAYVLELRYETGIDISGQPAIWIWVVFQDAAARKDVYSTHIKKIRSLLEDAVRELRIEHWPYVSFRTKSELEPLEPVSHK